MLLSDLFVAGIEGLPAQARVKLGPGVTGVSPAPADLERVLEALFYSQGFDPSSPFVDRDVRAGCVLFDDEQNAYRLMRELGKGTAQLSKALDGAYTPLAESGAEVVQVLRGQLRMPSREAFLALFALGCDDLPSRSNKTAAAASVMVALDTSGLQDELDHLRDKRKEFGSSRDREFALDGLQKKKFALDDIAKKRAQLAERLQASESTLQQGRALDDLPAGFADLISGFDRTRAKHKEEKERLLEDLRVMEERGVPATPKPLLENVSFLAGVLGGAMLLVGAAFLEGDMRLLGLIDIAPFGLAAMNALTFVEELQASDAFQVRERRLIDRLKKIEAKFERDTATVRDAMKRLDVQSPDALITQLNARAGKKEERDQLLGQLQAFDASEGQALLAGDMPGLDAQIGQIEDQLAASSMSNEAGEVERRINEIEGSLARGAAPTPAAVVVPTGEPVPFLKLLQALAELTGQPLTVLAPGLATKTSAMAQTALGLAGSLSLDELGRASWQGRTWATLAMPLQDNVFVAGHLAAFQMIAHQVRFPLFLIGLDALPHVLPYAQALPLLEGIGQTCQVVMVAHDPAALLGCTSIVTFA